MNLQDLERITYRRLGKPNPTSPDSEVQTRIRQFLNERHRRLLRMFPQLRDDVLTFASVSGTPRYALPEQGVARVNRIWETTNDRTLEMWSLSRLRAEDPDPQSSTPWAWVPLSYTQVHTQPSDASEVFAKSTSASDTTQTIYVEGIITGGYRRTASVTLTGATAVTLASAITNFIQIDKCYLSAAAVGIVTLHEDSGSGTELSRIAIGDTYAKFLSFLLYPTPSGAVTYTCDITRAVGDMSNATDEPLLPVDFHDLLAVGARLDEYEKADDSRRKIAEVEWDEGVKELTSWIVAHPDYSPSLGGGSPGISRLGAWYPADQSGARF